MSRGRLLEGFLIGYYEVLIIQCRPGVRYHSRKRPIVQTPQNGLIPLFLPYSWNGVRVFKNQESRHKWKWTLTELTGIKR